MGRKSNPKVGRRIELTDEDKVCCMCGEHKKFLGRVNTGKKYYCNSCMRKINESGMDYWKPCSFTDFFKNWSKEINTSRKKRDGSTL